MLPNTVHNLLVVFGGRVSFVALSLIGTSLVLRRLGTAEVGVYWLCITVVKIVTSCLSDSLDFAVLRSVPSTLRFDHSRAFDTLRAAFVLRMGTVGALAVGGAVFSTILAELLFKRSDYAHMLVLTGAACIGDMLMRSAMGYFQACQRFNRLVVLEFVSQTARFGGIVALLLMGYLSATTAMWAYCIPSYLAFAAGLASIPEELRRPRLPSRAELVQVFAYTRWIVLVMALGAVYERLDVVLLGFFRGPAEVGLYAPAVMLAMAPELIVSVVLTVLNPQVSQYYSSGRFTELLRRYLRYAVPVGVLAMIGAITIGGPVMHLMFGSKYMASILLFKILAVGTLCFAMITPPYSALLSMFAPRRTLVITVLGLVLVLVGGAVVMPAYGAVGTAALMTCVRIILAGVVTLLATPLTKERPALAFSRVGAE